MNTAVVLMHALKDTCALHCLVALHLAGPHAVTQQAVMTITGFDDGAVHRGLHKLLALGLVTCTGQTNHSAWRLAPAAAQLPLPFASVPEPEPEPEPEPAPEPGAAPAVIEPPAAPATPSPLPQPAARIPHSAETAPMRERVKNKNQSLSRPTTLSPPILNSPSRPAARNDDAAHLEQLHAVFQHANIWPGGRAALARALVRADGALWVRQALGWLCYAVRCFPSMRLGAVIYPALRDRLAAPPEFLPPPELAFPLALAWAARGGEDAPGYANELAEAGDAGDAGEGSKGPKARADSGEGGDAPARLLRAALARLQAESPRAQLEHWLRGARLLPLGPGAWQLAVANPLARDWVDNRLRERLAKLLGEGIELEIVAQGDAGKQGKAGN